MAIFDVSYTNQDETEPKISRVLGSSMMNVVMQLKQNEDKPINVIGITCLSPYYFVEVSEPNEVVTFWKSSEIGCIRFGKKVTFFSGEGAYQSEIHILPHDTYAKLELALLSGLSLARAQDIAGRS